MLYPYPPLPEKHSYTACAHTLGYTQSHCTLCNNVGALVLNISTEVFNRTLWSIRKFFQNRIITCQELHYSEKVTTVRLSSDLPVSLKDKLQVARVIVTLIIQYLSPVIDGRTERQKKKGNTLLNGCFLLCFFPFLIVLQMACCPQCGCILCTVYICACWPSPVSSK